MEGREGRKEGRKGRRRRTNPKFELLKFGLKFVDWAGISLLSWSDTPS